MRNVEMKDWDSIVDTLYRDGKISYADWKSWQTLKPRVVLGAAKG